MQKLNLQKTNIMSIINLTHNSFAAIGKFQEPKAAVDYALQLIEQGADIIDVGAEATNPGLESPIIDIEQELQMLIPFITLLRKQTDKPISVDTSKPEVMQAVIEAGADIINDVRALRLPGALETVAQLNVPVILMHMEYPFGVPEQKTEINDITKHVKDFLLARVEACLEAGIRKENIILDISVGGGSFGKNTQQNLQLIKNTQQFVDLGYPVLAGVSYKLYIGELLGLAIPDRSTPSLISALFCAQKGVKILRVHEVLQTKQALEMLNLINEI